MGTFNEKQVEKLNKVGISIDIEKEYTKEEKKNIAFKLSEYLFSQSTKNNFFQNKQRELADIIDIVKF